MDEAQREEMLGDNTKNPGRAEMLRAHAAPFSIQNSISTTYWYATAHDVPYPEFICQVMMLLAQKFFPKWEMVLPQEHEGSTCTTADQRKGL